MLTSIDSDKNVSSWGQLFTADSTHVYDPRGNLLSKSNAGGTLTYTYDAANNLKRTSSDSTGGLDLAYDYDGFNRLDIVYDSGAAQPPLEHSYTYDANGNLESLTYSNGVEHTWIYDTQNRLQDLAIRNSSFVTLNSYAYTLKASGHRSGVVESTGRTVGYTLDNHYRLTQETVSGDPSVVNGTSDWAYDLVGNRLSQVSDIDSVLNQAETYSANNWLDSDAYDANGNTLGSQVSAPALYDQYDWRNRLIRREQTDGTIIEIIYDGFGDRLKKTVTPFGDLGESTFYLVDRNNLTGYAQVVEEVGQGDELQVIYSYGLDLISQDRRDDDGSGNFTQSFYLYDGLGTVRALTDAAGLITDTYTYDAWGVIVNETHNSPVATHNSYRFTGEQWDADLEMYFLRARYLNVATGRFHTMDTFEGVSTDPVTLHKYLYANAGPAMYVDPSGLFSVNSVAFTTAVIGTLATMATINVFGLLRGRSGISSEAFNDALAKRSACFDRAISRYDTRLAFVGNAGKTALGQFLKKLNDLNLGKLGRFGVRVNGNEAVQIGVVVALLYFNQAALKITKFVASKAVRPLGYVALVGATAVATIPIAAVVELTSCNAVFLARTLRH